MGIGEGIYQAQTKLLILHLKYRKLKSQYLLLVNKLIQTEHGKLASFLVQRCNCLALKFLVPITTQPILLPGTMDMFGLKK